MNLESLLLDARQRIDGLLRDVRAGAARGPVLVKLLALTSDMTNYVLGEAAEQIRNKR